jgi:hypothetical protein
MNIKLIKEETWKFPPTLNRHGFSKFPHDLKTIMYIESDDFPHKVIMTSDLHSHSIELFRRLEKVINLGDFHVITAGDMSGTLVMGPDSDSDTTPFYKEILPKVKSLYLVQGNHDLPPSGPLHLRNILTNKDGSKSYLEDGKIQDTPYGIIGGVHGIISNKPHPYKKSAGVYFGDLKKFNKDKNRPDILVTHDTPRFFYNNQQFIGNDNIYDEVLRIRPKMYLYGHCHHHLFHTVHNKINFFNLDGRVLIWNCKPQENPVNV